MPRFEEQQQAGPRSETIAPKKPRPRLLEGKLVSIIGNKLVMTSKEGTEYSHTLAEDVKLSFDGATCRAEDMKAGSKIRLTMRKPNRKPAASVEVEKAVRTPL